MIEANVKDAETKMQKSLDALAKEILTIRTGRASPALVDKIPVEYYGNPAVGPDHHQRRRKSHPEVGARTEPRE